MWLAAFVLVISGLLLGSHSTHATPRRFRAHPRMAMPTWAAARRFQTAWPQTVRVWRFCCWQFFRTMRRWHVRSTFVRWTPQRHTLVSTHGGAPSAAGDRG